MKPRHKWTPMQRATATKAPAPELIARAMQTYSLDEAAARKMLDETRGEHWVNDLYQVEAKRDEAGESVWLCIRRRDGGPILRDWRHFQNIKNEIVGPECEAVELYPAESRLVDTSNKFHLFCSTDPTFRFPFGYGERDVSYTGSESVPGMRQRPL